MFNSIRWRLQAWYALILLVVIVAFAVILDVRIARSRWREFDGNLVEGAMFLELNLRGPPPSGEGGPDRGPPPEPPGGIPNEDEPHRPPPPRRPPRHPRPEDLALPGNWDWRLPPRDRPFFVIWRPDGSVLKSTSDEPLDPPDFEEFVPPPRPRLVQRDEYREALVLGPRESRIMVGQSSIRLQNELNTLAWQLAGAGVIVLSLGLGGGWLFASRILRPIETIASTASSISANNLSGRIDAANVAAELQNLASILNAMFDRLDSAFQQQTRFTADASHELRTPLAVLRTHAELALNQPRTPEEYRETLGICLHAARRMTGLVDGLLILARVDAGKLELHLDDVDLAKLAAENVRMLTPLAEAKQVKFTSRLEPARVQGDPARLTQVINNLVTNAIDYNRSEGSVQVGLESGNGAVTLSVTDTGPGIPEKDRPHLFERFYRVDEARSRATGGNGLGLAICKTIVVAHGGQIGFEPGVDGKGTRFWVRLPVSR